MAVYLRSSMYHITKFLLNSFSMQRCMSAFIFVFVFNVSSNNLLICVCIYVFGSPTARTWIRYHSHKTIERRETFCMDIKYTKWWLFKMSILSMRYWVLPKAISFHFWSIWFICCVIVYFFECGKSSMDDVVAFKHFSMDLNYKCVSACVENFFQLIEFKSTQLFENGPVV